MPGVGEDSSYSGYGLDTRTLVNATHIKKTRLILLVCVYIYIHTYVASQMVLVVKNLPANAGDIRD